MSWTFILLMSSLISLLIGTIVGLTQFRIKRLFAYSTIVRLCASFIQEVKDFIHCSQMYPTTELGQGENPRLNLASPLKWLIRLIQQSWLVTRVEFPMIKAKLPEVYLQGSSTIGSYLGCYRVSRLSITLKLWVILWTNLFLGVINTYKVEKGQSKGNLRINDGTKGLPKAINGYGNRGIIVPSVSIMRKSNELKNSVALGRIPGQWNCNHSSTAGDSSTVKSDAIRKLQWLEEKFRENKNFEAKDIYKLMYNEKLYEIAYGNLKSKPGNMTQGIIPTTLDGFSIEVIQGIINELKEESFKFKPGRRVMIPKASGGERPLTVAPPRDKIVQEVMRMILEAIFESSFSQNSHGFRPNRSCHTALRQIYTTFGVAAWYIEGDISKCFDSFNHETLIRILKMKIKDERLIRLIIKALKAGYFEFGVYRQSLTGTPQGSIISPLLCNIYMNELDNKVEEIQTRFAKGDKAKGNPLWVSYNNKKRRAKTLIEKLQLHKLLLKVPSKDPKDPNFKKLVYVRYADDWIIGIRGSRNDCVTILQEIKDFLKQNLDLELSEKKTLITNANNEKALFLGTKIFRSRHQTFSKNAGFSRRIGKEMRLEAPLDRITKKLTEAKLINNGDSAPRFLWMSNSKDQIIALYNSVYRGITNYYSFAHNLGNVSGYVHNMLKSSCAKLLAAKFTMRSQKKIFDTYGKDLKGKDDIAFVEPIYKNSPWNFKIDTEKSSTTSNGLLKTLYAESIYIASLKDLSCSSCGSKQRVEMHHVRHMKDLNPKVSKIDALMAKRRRKQIALCRVCHMEHHLKSKQTKI